MKFTSFLLPIALIQTVTLFTMETKPMGKLRLCKEYVLGYWDQFYGWAYLSNPRNYEKNFIKGYETPECWKREITERVCLKIYRIGKNSTIPAYYMDIVKEQPKYRNLVFKIAANELNVPVMQELLEVDPSLANLNLSDERALSPLYVAVEEQNLPAVEMLAQYGAHINKCITTKPGYFSAYDAAQSINNSYQKAVIAARIRTYAYDESDSKLEELKKKKAIAAKIVKILETYSK